MFYTNICNGNAEKGKPRRKHLIHIRVAASTNGQCLLRVSHSRALSAIAREWLPVSRAALNPQEHQCA